MVELDQVPVVVLKISFEIDLISTLLIVIELGAERLNVPEVSAVEEATIKFPPLVASNHKTTYFLVKGFAAHPAIVPVKL